MVRHVREGQGLCPIQVTSSSWNEDEDLEKVQLYIQINVIGKDWIKYPKRSRGVFPCLDDCSSKQVTQVTLASKAHCICRSGSSARNAN